MEPPAGETFRVERGLQTGAQEGVANLLDFEETHPMPFHAMFRPSRCTDEVMHIEVGQTPLDETGADTGDLQLRFVNQEGVNGPRIPRLGGEPGFDGELAARDEKPRHTGHGPVQIVHGPDITDGAEKAGDHIEAVVQLEVHHVPEMKGSFGKAEPGGIQHHR